MGYGYDLTSIYADGLASLHGVVGNTRFFSYATAVAAPLDPTADATLEAWCKSSDGRTIEEFAADGGSPITPPR